MSPYKPMKTPPPPHQYKSGDVLIVFGELFNRGYVNGLIDAAINAGMKVIAGTVGRREKDNKLRPLTTDELNEKKIPIINVPIEASFDLEKADSGVCPVDQLQGVKTNEWDQLDLNWDDIEDSRQKGQQRFCNQTNQFLSEVQKHIPDGANVLFAHTMAGGFPRARVVMPITNKLFKGTGDRYTSSELFWSSELGKLCEKSFQEVTCETFRHLIELSSNLRHSIESRGNHVAYVAYGYHGTDILIDDNFQWQSYSPYLQGWAKINLENVAKEKSNEGIKVTVYNAPEILTNSSSIFPGVEMPLYRLLAAFEKNFPDSSMTKNLIENCRQRLNEDYSLEVLHEKLAHYFQSDIVSQWSQYEKWPQHNGAEQMSLMLQTSQDIIHMHKSNKDLMTLELSEVVFQSCGKIILSDSWSCPEPVIWIGHDMVSQSMA